MSNHTTTTLHPHLQPQFSLQLQHYIFNNINYTTTTSTLQLQVHLQLQLQLRCTSLHHTTSCSCGRGGHRNHSKNHSHLGPSVGLLCHPCITTTYLSYSFLSLKLLPPPCAALLEICKICKWHCNILHGFHPKVRATPSPSSCEVQITPQKMLGINPPSRTRHQPARTIHILNLWKVLRCWRPCLGIVGSEVLQSHMRVVHVPGVRIMQTLEKAESHCADNVNDTADSKSLHFLHFLLIVE